MTCSGPNKNLEPEGCNVCAPGYEVDDIGDCYKCEGFVLEGVCKPCKSACKTCDGPTVFVDSDFGCLECADGYYQGEGNACLKCDANCDTCEKDSTLCTSCGDGGSLNGVLECVCEEGYLTTAVGKCVKCHESCATCDAEAPDECTECAENRSLSDGKCICAEGWLLNERTKECVECSG